MLYPLFLSLLVTLASGYPRSKGQRLQHTIEAPSGYQSLNYGLPFGSQPEPRSQGQTFQVDPNTLHATPLVGAPPPQSEGATFHVNPNTLQATRADGALAPTVFSQTSPNNVAPQRLPNPSPTPQFVNQPNPDITFGGLERNNIPTRNAPVPGSVEMAKRLIGNPPGGALLVGSNPPLFPIEKRLISNYTKLRPVVTDTFRCNKGSVPNYAGYGYYADVDNECQIFHICLPWKELYPKQFAEDVTYQFSFICPNQTVFSQDVMTCTWKSEALPCESSPELYWLNSNFFRRVPGEFGMKYAAVNEKIVPPLVYDYDDFNPPKPAQG